MNRTATTKLIATALAVASLGLASTAQAAEDPAPGTGAAPAAPAAPAETPAAPAETPAPEAPAVEEDNQALVQEDTKSEEDKLFERFQKECPNGEFSPGQFCKDFARGKFNTKPPTAEEKDRFKRFCNMKDAEPSHNDKKFCEDYRNGDFGCDEFVTAPKCKNGKGGSGSASSSSTGNGGHNGGTYERTDDYEETQPAAEKADKGSLPFTGLEIWQLGLLGIVLVGGGFGARRLLAS